MRNSALPIVLAVLLVTTMVAMELRHPDEEPGVRGPEINAGIFRLPTKARFRIPSAEIAATNTITVVAPEGPEAGQAARWRVVVVAADDREPLTCAVVLALAELLTEHGSVVIIDQLGAQPLLVGADRALRIATVAAALPVHAGGACTATLRVDDRLLAFPLGHPAARAQPAVDGPLLAALTIAHRSQGQGAAAVAWPNWYAGIGRGIATDLLAAIVPAGVPAVVDEQRQPRADLPARADWGTPLPAPPRHELVRWCGAVQEDFVRGWIGELGGPTALDEHGARVPSIGVLEKALAATRLLKDIAWIRAPDSSDDHPVWNREQDGASLSATRSATGWELVLWQPRQGVVAIYQRWLDAAAGGDAAARRELRRYRQCEVVPAELRAKAEALLGDGG